MNNSTRRAAFAFFIATALASSAIAAPPSKGPLPPSATLFGGAYNFPDSTTTFPFPITVPQDGAWFYGNSSTPASGGFMDCAHHYAVDLVPSTLSPSYSPFLTLGIMPQDGCFDNKCFSCSINWGGTKTRIDYTTNAGPGFLPGGAGTAVLRTLNSPPNDTVSFGLSQVNMTAMQSMTLYEATADDLPVQASQDEVDSRAYIAASDDHVPLVPRFVYGTDVYPAPPQPNIAFTGKWDTGDEAGITVKNPYPGNLPGDQILLISIPSMKTGNHKITITAKLPSGKTFTPPAYQVFIYNAAMETSIGGGAFTTGPANFMRVSDVHFRVAQQNTKGKTLKITNTDWKYHVLATGIDILGVDDGLAVDATEWGGTIVQTGTVSVAVTIQTGKTKRTSHTAIATTAVVQPRTGGTWQTTQALCENCFDDLGIKGGGTLDAGLVLPTDQNILDIPSIPSAQSALALGMSGDRLGYANGIIPDSLVSKLDARTVLKPYPLYRPLNNDNDQSDWPNRYTITQVASGPNKDYWYLTAQDFRTDWAYAVNAYFNANSAPGANPANYYSLVFDPACGNTANAACYIPVQLACWPTAYPGQSYVQAALAAGYQMGLLQQQIQAHEKLRHWTQFLVDFVANNRDQYDIGTVMERQAVHGGTEQAARDLIDLQVRTIDFNYIQPGQGGALEVNNDPKAPFPLISDLPLNNANCALH